MEFWALEVPPGGGVDVDIGEGGCLQLDRACLGKVDEECVTVKIKVGGNEQFLANLHSKLHPCKSFDMMLVDNFKITHDMRRGSLYLFGAKRKQLEHEYASSDTDTVEKDFERVEYEVKPGKKVQVKVGEGRIENLLSVWIGKDAEKKDETVLVHIVVDGKRFVVANLNPLTRRVQELALTLDRDFKVSHTLKRGDVLIHAYRDEQRDLINDHKSDTEEEEA